MAILSRRKGKNADRDGSDGGSHAGGSTEKKTFAARKPANTAFKQQRLKAWQPILTPKTVLPTFFLVGLIFAPIGAVLYYYASRVSEFTIDYTDCQQAGPEVVSIPQDKYSYQMATNTTAGYALQPPQWQYVDNTTAPAGKACILYFDVPADLKPTVLLYYKLTNYYQNHRRYVKSIDMNQLLGKYSAPSDLQSGNCKPLGEIDGKGVYPCGLIANSVFNDTIFDPVLLNQAGSASSNAPYVMSQKNIIWPGEKEKYVRTTQDPATLTPPPFWRGNFPNTPKELLPYAYPDGYTADNIYNPSDDEHFMVWMRVAGLPTFRKLYKRNDNDIMQYGRYSITIFDNYPVAMFKGTKSIVFSTVTWVGGRSLFLGAAYIATAGLCVLLGILFTARHLIRPRKLGDLSLLSWND